MSQDGNKFISFGECMILKVDEYKSPFKSEIVVKTIPQMDKILLGSYNDFSKAQKIYKDIINYIIHPKTSSEAYFKLPKDDI